jgi:hypothetical protein
MSCASETWSSTVVGSQPSLCLDQHSTSVATPSCCESKTETYQHKIHQRVIRDHTHTNPEYVWGDEGPVYERKETP